MRQRLDKAIRKKEAEILELELQATEIKAKIHDALTYIKALQDAARLLPKEGNDNDGVEEVTHSLKEGSDLARARDLILKAGKPQRIDALLSAMGREVNKKTRTSLGGSIAGYARKGRVFTRSGPNTFGLIEMESSAKDEEPEAPSEAKLRLIN